MALDLRQYLSLYVAEAAEHLSAFARELVRLEKAVAGGEDASPAVDALFRHVHSVKGMSASMQLDGIASLAHRAEDLAAIFRGDPGRLDGAAADLLLAAGDALQGMVQASAGGENPAADPALVARLVEGVGRYGRASAPTAVDPVHPERSGAAPAATRSKGTVDPRSSASGSTGSAEAAGAERPPVGRPPVRLVHVDVEIAGACPVPAVRAFLVVKKLGLLGTISTATPTVDELKAGRIPGKKLSVVLETAEAERSVERALAQISDLSSVSIRLPDEAAPAARPASPAPAAITTLEPSRTVRVRTEILDGFLDAVGELILATARIREIGRTVRGEPRPALDEGVDRLHAIVKDLHDKVMTVRMTPLATVTDGLPRAARDVARKLGKQVDLDVRGAEIELDRAILEELSDPLLHVVRNAVDHGIEPGHVRIKAGKRAAGRIAVNARRDRDRVIVEVSDDGKGMDPARLRDTAVQRGLLTREAAAALSDREALLLSCLPGVSTAETVTDVSGRGVGLDAVKRSIEAIGGAIELESTPGRGSRIAFRLPLTVAVQPVLLVRIGEEVLGVPIAKVHGAAQVLLSTLDRSQGAPVLAHDGALVPVHDLTRLLGFPGAGRDDRAVVVAEGGESGLVGLAVDGLIGQHEAVLKPLGAPLDLVPGLSAVTVLGNGRPVFILDVQRLLAA